MSLLSTPELLRRVTERGGLDPASAGNLTRITIKALASQLHAAQALELADELPPTLSEWILSADAGGPRGLPVLMEAVAVYEPGSISFTGEHAAVVCQVLAEALRPEALRALKEALPDDVASLLAPREPAEPFKPVRLDPGRRSLAEADAASVHPLFRSRPAERAHSESVARAANPHAETKLSSAKGLTQEREEETLATAHPRRR